jgi:thioesterase domain-containing protein
MGSAGHKPASKMIETLTSTWRSVLQRPSIGVDDHFFDCGGTLRSADVLFAEIAREFSRELPSSTIYHAPTIAALFSLLQQPRLPQISPVVQVKAGTENPPIFIVHGLAGTVPFFDLGQHIQTANPVYGIQAQGVDGMEPPLDRIEDMAALYLDALKSLQPHGPYILIGYSFGGLVTLEMAQRLAESGEPIALLVLVDAYPDPRYLSPVQRLLLFARRSKHYIFQSKHRWNRALRYVAPGLESRLGIAGTNPASDPLPETSQLSFARTTLQVKEKAYLALARYQPRFYGGKITFLKSENDSYFPANPVAVWKNLASEFDFEIVPGGHLDMLTTDSEGLAGALTRYVKEAPCHR